MKKYLFSTSASPLAQSVALLALRLTFGLGMCFGHGWGKLMSYSDKLDSFPDPLGIGSAASLTAVVFAEVVCALLVALGLFTRGALIPLIFTMLVAAFIVHGGDPFSGKEMALVYLTAYGALFLSGPGKVSLDHQLR